MSIVKPVIKFHRDINKYTCAEKVSDLVNRIGRFDFDVWECGVGNTIEEAYEDWKRDFLQVSKT
jgi:hypothetical protein